MNTLIFDTETTGLARQNLDHVDPRQPMPIQLGMKLDAENRVERHASNVLIRPEGWTMDEGAMKATGLSDQIATDYGTHIITAVELFLDILGHADVVVAHNAAFDIIIMRRAAKVYAEMTGQTYVDPFEGKTLICTMFASQNIVKALPKRRGEWKWPKLEECVRFFWNEQLEGAHDALVDVRACARVYYHLLDEGVFSGEYRYQ